jgi:regulator of cell morphogenesis and NO signaling
MRNLLTTTSTDHNTSQDWAAAPLGELVRFLVETQHHELRSVLRSAERTIESLCSQPGEKLSSLRRAFLRLADELEAHMSKEESVLFPAIERMEQAALRSGPFPPPAFGSVHNPISMMEQEHNSTVALLAAIRGLTGNYTLNDPDCDRVRVMSRMLQLLDGELLENIRLEHQVLFPRARALEGKLAGSV